MTSTSLSMFSWLRAPTCRVPCWVPGRARLEPHHGVLWAQSRTSLTVRRSTIMSSSLLSCWSSSLRSSSAATKWREQDGHRPGRTQRLTFILLFIVLLSIQRGLLLLGIIDSLALSLIRRLRRVAVLSHVRLSVSGVTLPELRLGRGKMGQGASDAGADFQSLSSGRDELTLSRKPGRVVSPAYSG